MPATGWIAYDSDSGDFNRDIYRMRPNGTERTRFTKEPGVDMEPAFSPDGSTMAFTSDRSGSLQIHLLAANGSVTQLTHRPEGASQSVFSRDGSLIAFHSGMSVFVSDLDGMNERLMAAGSDWSTSNSSPQFSTDGTELIYDRINEINTVKLDGSGVRQIVQNTTTISQAPALSLDGKEIAYQVGCNFERALSIWRTPVDRNTLPCEGRRITPTSEINARQPTWGPNHLVAYERAETEFGVSQLAVVSTELDSVACALTARGNDDRNPAWFFGEP